MPTATTSALQRYAAYRPRPAAALSTAQIAGFLVLHVPLGVLMRMSSVVSTLHAYAALGLGMLWVSRSRTPERGIYLMAYVIGAELLWRGTQARIFYETGKFALFGISVYLLLRFRLVPRADKKALLYFLLLLPSLAVMDHFDRSEISFNLSGGLALAGATMFLSTQRLDRRQLETAFLALLAPILGLAAIGTRATLAAESLELHASTKVTTAGIGPNQVSSILGLGAFVAFLFVVTHQESRRLRFVLAGIALWLATQNLLTFSRGGFWASIGAICVASFYLLRDRRTRTGLLLRGSLVIVVGLFVIFPFLDLVSSGGVSRRFTNFQPTGRDAILEADIDAFQENPVFGVGPGGSKDYHALKHWGRASAHTEFTRLLAEHGMFGVLAILTLLLLVFQRWARPMPLVARACVMAFTAWAFLFMLHSAMRLAAPSFLFGLGAATLYLVPAPRRFRHPLPALRRPPVSTRPPGRLPLPAAEGAP